MSLPAGWTLGDNGFWYDENGLGPYARSNLDTFHLVGGGDVTGDAISGGGASAFTDLTDCPATIIPNAPLIGNAAGDGIQCGPTDGNDLELWGGPDVGESGPGNVLVHGASAGTGTGRAGGNVYLTAGSGDGAGGSGSVNIEGGDVTFQNSGPLLINGGVVLLPSLPTSDPAVTSALWNDAGTLKISAG